jgi:hypothetical protein
MQARGGLEQSKAVKGFTGYTVGYPIGESATRSRPMPSACVP